MGRPKALLPIAGETFIGRIVAALKQTQAGRIIVVLGHNSDDLAAAIRPLGVEILVNTDYKLGQLSSLQVAVRSLQGDETCDGMLLHLVDHPYIDAALVDRMIARFYESKKASAAPPWLFCFRRSARSCGPPAPHRCRDDRPGGAACRRRFRRLAGCAPRLAARTIARACSRY